VIERCGKKIGFIGIAERDWTVTFKNLEVEIEYLNYKKHAEELVNQLRNNQLCDYVIALTHMRMHHDVKFAEQVPGIGLVLAGHDHFYRLQGCESKKTSKSSLPTVVPVIKSGSDFEDYSEITLEFNVSQPEFDKLKADHQLNKSKHEGEELFYSPST